jgi:hypothetical protein
MIPPNESDGGLRAYEQVLAFDVLKHRQLPLIYIMGTLILVVLTMIATMELLPTASLGFGAAALFSAVFEWWNWNRLSRRDARNRALLAELEAKYGEDLPWIQVERQLAELEKIELEIASGELQLPPDEN